jgi:hypothetical protein
MKGSNDSALIAVLDKMKEEKRQSDLEMDRMYNKLKDEQDKTVRQSPRHSTTLTVYLLHLQ